MTGAPRKALFWTGVLIIWFGSFSSCATRSTFRFEPSPRVEGEPIIHDGVAIPVFEDRRGTGPGGRQPLNHNLKNLALIPIVPFAASLRDQPERTWFDSSAHLNGFDPARDLAAAFRSEVESQGLFRAVLDWRAPSHGERYELIGVLRDSHVVEGYITYGVSAVSLILHVLGLPEGTLRAALVFDLELRDRRDGSVVWKHQVDTRSTRITWIYSSDEADHLCAMFQKMTDEVVRPAVADLRRVLAVRATGGTLESNKSSTPAPAR